MIMTPFLTQSWSKLPKVGQSKHPCIQTYIMYVSKGTIYHNLFPKKPILKFPKDLEMKQTNRKTPMSLTEKRVSPLSVDRISAGAIFRHQQKKLKVKILKGNDLKLKHSIKLNHVF